MQPVQDVIWSTGKKSVLQLRPWEQLPAFLHLLPVAFLQPLWFTLGTHVNLNYAPQTSDDDVYTLRGKPIMFGKQFSWHLLFLFRLEKRFWFESQQIMKSLEMPPKYWNGRRIITSWNISTVNRKLVYVFWNSWPPNKSMHSHWRFLQGKKTQLCGKHRKAFLNEFGFV